MYWHYRPGRCDIVHVTHSWEFWGWCADQSEALTIFPPPNQATHGHFDCGPCLVDGEFEPCLAGVGSLNQECQALLVEYKGYIFKYRGV